MEEWELEDQLLHQELSIENIENVDIVIQRDYNDIQS